MTFPNQLSKSVKVPPEKTDKLKRLYRKAFNKGMIYRGMDSLQGPEEWWYTGTSNS